VACRRSSVSSVLTLKPYLFLKFYRTGNYAALKICMAKYSDVTNMEVTFKPTIHDHPGANHLSTKIDSFVFEGPNGSHLCLVSEPLGRNFQDLAEDITRFK
jgi:hypothetical protein